MMPDIKPARTLRDVFNAVDPARPLQSADPRYVDCTAVRGNEDAVVQLFDTITWSDEVAAQLFTGHRGCGKSTELLRLKDRLEKADWTVIYFQADEILDLNDVTYSDILVAIARQVDEGLRNLGVALEPELLDQVFEWFAEVVFEYENVNEARTELQSEFKLSLPALVSPFAQIMAKATGQLKTGHQSKEMVRRNLDPQISHLIENINLLLRDGEASLRRSGKQGLVILIDNLDRISFRTLSDERRNTHDALYIEHGAQLRALRTHLVYTVPIAMFYSPQASVRDLMILVRYACRYAQNRHPKPIDRAAVEKGVDRLVSEYSRLIPEEHFPLLAQVHRTKEVRNDDAHRQMLHNLSVLEYVNGAPPWHDVHPAVLRLPKFQEAVA